MPRLPFIVVISLWVYWNWQSLHAITAMLIDSHFLFKPKLARKEKKRKEKHFEKMASHHTFCAKLADVLQALPNDF